MKKRGAVVGVALVASLLQAPPLDALEVTPPNVVVFVTDDQPRETMEAMRATGAWFQGGGAWFPNGLVTTPLCCPSRSTIFSGRYAHNHGVTQNGSVETATSLDQTKTIQYALQGAGFRTGIAGKFLNSWPLDTNPPYFDRWAIHSTSTSYWGPNMNVDGAVGQVSGFEPDLLGDYALSFLDDFETTDAQPFFLYVATIAPHKPFSAAPRYQDAPVSTWDGDPAVFETDRSDKPPIVRNQTATFEDGAGLRVNQMRSLMAADDLVERVMTRLEELGEQDTLAIFLSDNGLMWAHHGVAAHKRLPYTQSVGVPFAISWPGHVTAGSVDPRMVANVDIVPTIGEAAGVSLGWEPDGISLLDTDAVRSRILLEYFRSSDAPSFPPWASILTPAWQYTEYYDDASNVTFREYYDLVTDPWQNQNLLANADPNDDPNVEELSGMLAIDRACAGASCAALATSDVQPPSAPGGPTAGFDGLGRVVVEWDPATDDVGIVAHQLFRDGLLLTLTGSTTRIIDPLPVPGSTHTYEVAALDAAGNVSAFASAPPIEIPPADSVFIDGFESGELSAWSVVRGVSVVSGGSSGRRAVVFGANGSPSLLRKTLSAAPATCVVETDVWLTSQGRNPVILLRVLSETETGVVQVLVRKDGTLAYKVEQAKRTRGSTTVLPMTGWHALTVRVVAAGDSSVVELYLDGVSLISRVEAEGIAAIGKVQVGDHVWGRTFALQADDVIVRAPAA